MTVSGITGIESNYGMPAGYKKEGVFKGGENEIKTSGQVLHTIPFFKYVTCKTNI